MLKMVAEKRITADIKHSRATSTWEGQVKYKIVACRYLWLPCTVHYLTASYFKQNLDISKARIAVEW